MNTEYEDGGGRGYCVHNKRNREEVNLHSAPATSRILLQDSEGEWKQPEEEG